MTVYVICALFVLIPIALAVAVLALDRRMNRDDR